METTDLISREALLEEFRWLKSAVNPTSVPEVEEYIARIEAAEAVDAELVVRCGDCARWYRYTEVDLERGDCRRYNVTKHECGYCDRGERRTDV